MIGYDIILKIKMALIADRYN